MHAREAHLLPRGKHKKHFENTKQNKSVIKFDYLSLRFWKKKKKVYICVGGNNYHMHTQMFWVKSVI